MAYSLLLSHGSSSLLLILSLSFAPRHAFLSLTLKTFFADRVFCLLSDAAVVTKLLFAFLLRFFSKHVYYMSYSNPWRVYKLSTI